MLLFEIKLSTEEWSILSAKRLLKNLCSFIKNSSLSLHSVRSLPLDIPEAIFDVIILLHMATNDNK